MKKFLAILLACAMVFAMAACANTDNPEKPSPEASTPSQSGDSSDTNNNPTEGDTDATEPSEGFKWQTHDVTLPEFATMEEIKVNIPGTESAQARVVVSPWQLDDFDMEAAQAALKNSPLFAGWVFGTEVTERGIIKNYKDIGQLTGYEWEKNIVAIEEYYDTAAYATDVSLSFKGNTQELQGCEQILLEIDIPEEELTKEIQDEVYKILKVIFGDKYAEVLCYAPITSGENLIMEVEQTNGIIYMRRNVSKYGLSFNMHMRSYKVNNATEGFPGDGSYQSIVKAPQYAYEFLNEKVGSLDVKNFSGVGSEMLKETFEGYIYTTPESNPYRVRYLTLDNGHTVEEFTVTGNIATEELSGSFAPDFMLEYEVVHNGTEITDVEMNFECGVGVAPDGDDAYYEQLRAKFFATANNMFKYVLKDEMDTGSLITKNEDGSYADYRFKTTVCGLEKDAVIDFAMGPTMAGPVIGYIYFKIA